MRIGIGLAVVALAAIGACGGGSSDGETKSAAQATTPTPSPTLAKLTAGQSCAQLNQVTEDLGGPGDWPIGNYGEFGNQTYLMYRDAPPEVAETLEDLAAKALYIGDVELGDKEGADKVTAAVGEWYELYWDMQDICARTDSPIARLPR